MPFELLVASLVVLDAPDDGETLDGGTPYGTLFVELIMAGLLALV